MGLGDPKPFKGVGRVGCVCENAYRFNINLSGLPTRVLFKIRVSNLAIQYRTVT